jgi:hypothetical protein
MDAAIMEQVAFVPQVMLRASIVGLYPVSDIQKQGMQRLGTVGKDINACVYHGCVSFLFLK